MIDGSNPVDMSIMKFNLFRMTLSPSCEAFVVFTLVTIPTFNIAGVDGFCSASGLNNVQEFLLISQQDSGFALGYTPIDFMFNDLSIL